MKKEKSQHLKDTVTEEWYGVSRMPDKQGGILDSAWICLMQGS
jgi:hypothetical protein